MICNLYIEDFRELGIDVLREICECGHPVRLLAIIIPYYLSILFVNIIILLRNHNRVSIVSIGCLNFKSNIYMFFSSYLYHTWYTN